jgi:hypothetical protein
MIFFFKCNLPAAPPDYPCSCKKTFLYLFSKKKGIEADYESYKLIVEDNRLIHPTELQKMLMKKELDSEWLTSELGEEVVGVCYCCMEKVANKTVN